MNFKTKRQIQRNVIYTILKYHDKIDFSGIANVDILAYRYLLLNVLKLKDDQDERRKLKYGLIKK